jgi:hypothetical protein
MQSFLSAFSDGVFFDHSRHRDETDPGDLPPRRRVCRADKTINEQQTPGRFAPDRTHPAATAG